jgi:hypothetical protein
LSTYRLAVPGRRLEKGVGDFRFEKIGGASAGVKEKGDGGFL